MPDVKNNYPTYLTLTNMRGMTPQKQNLFEVKWGEATLPTDFTSKLNIQNLDKAQNLFDSISDSVTFINNIWVFVQQVTLPTISLDSGEVQMPMFNSKFANKMTFGNFSVTLNDPYGVPCTQFFEQWMYILMANPEKQGINIQTSYKRNIEVDIYSGLEDETDPIFKYVIYGAYPSNIPQTNLDYANAEQKTVEMTFSYDFFEIQLNGTYIGNY